MSGRARRDWLRAGLRAAAGLPALGLAARPGRAQVPAPVERHPGLGRGFHLGEVFGRSEADYAALCDTGASLVRFGIALEPDDRHQRYTMAREALPELQHQLALCRRFGLRLVLVLRPQPEPEAPLWAHEPLQASLANWWHELAQRFAGQPEIAGFDLVNEPHPPGLGFAHKQQVWMSLAQRLAESVRRADRTRTLVLEPSPGARPMAFDTAETLPMPRVVYSLHMYEPFGFTHQRVGDPRFTGRVGYPGEVPAEGRWNAARLDEVLAPAERFARRHGVEIFVGEFGAPRWAPAGARRAWLADVLALFERHRWSWTYHAWREWHGWDAERADGEPQGRPARRAAEPTLALLRRALATPGRPNPLACEPPDARR